MSEYTPFEINEEDYKNIMNYLGEVPAKYANPLIQVLANMAKKASEDKVDKPVE